MGKEEIILCKDEIILQIAIDHDNLKLLIRVCILKSTEIFKRHLLAQPFKLLFAVRATIVSSPSVANGVLVELEHIHHSHLGNNTTKEVGALISTGSFDRKTTVLVFLS